MQKLISISDEQFYFAGRMRKKNEVFESEDEFVHVLGVAGRARPASDEEIASAGDQYETADGEASQPRGKRRGYNRRDMVAREPRQ
jgi:hypothetical protein